MPAWGYGVLEVVDFGVTVGFSEVPDVAGEGGFTNEGENAIGFGSVFGTTGYGRVELFNYGIQAGRLRIVGEDGIKKLGELSIGLDMSIDK